MQAASAFDNRSDAPDADPAAARRAAVLERQVERLERLFDAGMALIEGLTAQAAGAGPKVVEGDVALAYSRLSRAVRMATLLQSSLLAEEPPAARAEDDEAGAQGWDHDEAEDDVVWGRPLPEPSSRKMGRFSRLMRHIVECTEPPERQERLLAEASERLEDDEVRRAIAGRPYGEVIAMICRDLGLEPDWERVPHKPHRLGWATYDDIRVARDFARAAGPPAAAGASQARAPP